jgi:hypothetical protein
MLDEYPKEFVHSIMKSSTRNRPSSDTEKKGTVTILMLWVFPRNSDAMGTVSISGSFSKLNVHSVGH